MEIYRVLCISGNDAFALHELRYKPVGKASLIGFYLQHDGKDTLYFPDDVRFLNQDRYKVVEPLKLPQAYRRLKRTGVDYGDAWWHELAELFANRNVSSSNKAFKEDLRRLYLIPTEILPRSTVTGVLAFPVDVGTALDIVCKTDTLAG